MVAVLKACGDNLTRENVMKQAASMHDLKLPMLLPGITLSTSADDFAPIKQMQLEKFDGDDLAAVRRGDLGGRKLTGSSRSTSGRTRPLAVAAPICRRVQFGAACPYCGDDEATTKM